MFYKTNRSICSFESFFHWSQLFSFFPSFFLFEFAIEFDTAIVDSENVSNYFDQIKLTMCQRLRLNSWHTSLQDLLIAIIIAIIVFYWVDSSFWWKNILRAHLHMRPEVRFDILPRARISLQFKITSLSAVTWLQAK